MMLWGLSNLWRQDKEGGYKVHHGTRPVMDFPSRTNEDARQLNYFEQAFPLLFPYGIGGMEENRPVKLSLCEHVR
jgi:hypothetical protein